MSITVRPLTSDDDLAGWFHQQGDPGTVVVHGRVFRPEDVDGLVAERGEQVGGVLTWVTEGDTMELVSLVASTRREGIGSNLVAAAIELARDRGLQRLVLTTTNDNCTALIFWQRLGFHLIALRPGAVAASRRLKPGLPDHGENGVPIRDELDLELVLA